MIRPLSLLILVLVLPLLWHCQSTDRQPPSATSTAGGQASESGCVGLGCGEEKRCIGLGCDDKQACIGMGCEKQAATPEHKP